MEPLLAVTGARVTDDEAPARAYFDFLPLASPDSLDDGCMVRTPCRPAATLGSAIGVPGLWVKDESRQPTGTTKDRMAALVVAVFNEFGIEAFVSSSTGNSSTSIARAVRRHGSMRAHFFCGRDFAADQHFELDDRIALTVVDGSYAAASAAAESFARENGLCWEGGYFNWARREGLKIAYLEAFDAMERTPDVIVQAVSSGMGIAAARKGVYEYRQIGWADRMPRFLMVQQNTCAPMANAWREGRAGLTAADVVARPSGLARAILLGDPSASYPYMFRIASQSGGAIVSVTQDDLVTARAMLRELEGLDVCYSAAATVAAVTAEAAAGRIGRNEVVLMNLTGRHRDDSRQAVSSCARDTGHVTVT